MRSAWLLFRRISQKRQRPASRMWILQFLTNIKLIAAEALLFAAIFSEILEKPEFCEKVNLPLVFFSALCYNIK